MSSETSYFFLTQNFSSADLKAVERSIDWIDEGSEFQRRAELKKKLFRRLLERIGCKRSCRGFLFALPETDDENGKTLTHSLKGPAVLRRRWKKTMLIIVRRHRSAGHPSRCNRALLGVRQSAFKMERATLAWTRSNANDCSALISLCQTGQAYSSTGRTKDKYILQLMSVLTSRQICRRNPARFFPFAKTSSIWARHRRSEERVTRRGLGWETVFMGVSSMTSRSDWHAATGASSSGSSSVFDGEQRLCQEEAQVEAVETLCCRSSKLCWTFDV